jgi:hypothetical protein
VRCASRSLAALLAAGLLLTACAGGDGAGSAIGGEQDEAPDRTEDSDGATANDPEGDDEGETEPDPTVIPDDPNDIDEAYAQAVIDVIDGYYREALKVTLRAAPLPDGAPPVELVLAVNETFAPQWRESVLEDETRIFSDPEWSEEFEDHFVPADQYEPAEAVVRGVDVAEGPCLLIELERDLENVLRQPPDEPYRQGYVLVPHQEEDLSLNQTPWHLAVPEVPLDNHPEAFDEGRCAGE